MLRSFATCLASVAFLVRCGPATESAEAPANAAATLGKKPGKDGLGPISR